MSITAADPLDVADLVDLCDNLAGAGVLASQFGNAAADNRLAYALHGLSETEATGLATILDRLRA